MQLKTLCRYTCPQHLCGARWVASISRRTLSAPSKGGLLELPNLWGAALYNTMKRSHDDLDGGAALVHVQACQASAHTEAQAALPPACDAKSAFLLAETSAPAEAAVATAPEKASPTATATSSPSQAAQAAPQQQPQSVGRRQQAPNLARNLPPEPTPILPPTLPDDLSVFQNGVLLIDKPPTWTSFGVCAKLKGALRRLGVTKIGHAGTLDPLATGLLIVCTGKGTKHVNSFMAMHKAYSGTLRLGQATPSYDAESKPCEDLPWQHITDDAIQEAKQAFLGDLLQVPPMYSAIRVKGERLYSLAREGIEIERQSRAVSVTKFELWRDSPASRDMHFLVECSKGTYIRSLAHDLGKALDNAAHLVALRREAIGDFSVKDAWELSALVSALNARNGSRAEEGSDTAPEGKAHLHKRRKAEEQSTENSLPTAAFDSAVPVSKVVAPVPPAVLQTTG